MPQVQNDDVQIHYELYGQGPALVFLHPFGTNRYIWANQIFAFAKDHQVLVLDHRGHGQSGKNASQYGVPNMASDLLAVLDHANIDKAVLVGNSIGGMIALQTNLDAPARVVANFIVSSGTGLGKKIPPEAFAAYERDWKGVYGKIIEGATSEKTKKDSPHVHAFTQQTFQVEGNFSGPIFKANVKDPQGLFHWDIWGELSKIKAPTYVTAGTEDKIVPPQATQALAESIPGATFKMVPDVAHFYQLEKPAEFNADLREFLQGLGE